MDLELLNDPDDISAANSPKQQHPDGFSVPLSFGQSDPPIASFNIVKRW
jgi:hypothetical protein